MNMKTLLGFLILITLLSGCGVKHVNEPHQNESPQNTTSVGDKQEALKEDFIPGFHPFKNESPQNTTSVGDKQEAPKEDFIPGFHPFKDDPDNPSPHNPLVRKFGDIPEVRTYIRLNQKLRYGIGLSVDEAIAFYTAEAHLYPSLEAKARLKSWKKDKERYERLGILTDEPVMGFNLKADASDEDPAVNEVPE